MVNNMYFLNCFFIYSILGFILECLFTLITKNHFASEILYGPWTPVYGFGAIFVNGGEEREDLDWEKGTLIINGGTIKDNNSRAIWSAGNATINDGSITNNQTDGQGGAIMAFGTLNINGGTFKNNVAGGNGGAIIVGCYYNNCTDTNITGGNITNNTAGNLGGGIAVKSQATLKISGGTIDNNSSGYESTPYRFENLYFAIGLSLNEENIGMTLTRGKYYKIVSALNNSSAITLKNSTVSNGNDVILYSPITSSSQQWAIFPRKVIDGHVYHIFELKGNYYYMNLYGQPYEVAAGRVAEIYQWQDQSDYHWVFESAGNNKYYIKTYNSETNEEFCLGVTNGATTNNTTIKSEVCNKKTSQQWSFVQQ